MKKILPYLGIVLVTSLIAYRLPTFISVIRTFWPQNFSRIDLALAFSGVMFLLFFSLGFYKGLSTLVILVLSFLVPFSIINILAGRALELFLVTGYIALLWSLSLRTVMRIAPGSRAIQFLIFMLFNLAIALCFNCWDRLNQNVLLGLSICGFLLARVEIWNFFKKSKEQFPGNSRFVLTATITFLAVAAGLLVIQPLTEWDSSVGHIPTMMFYFQTKSFAANPFATQTFAHNAHHISALPFYAVGGHWGLKFWNLIMILGIFFMTQSLLQKACSVKSNTDRYLKILTGLLVITPSLIFSTIGTFQYDPPTLFFFLIILELICQLRLEKTDLDRWSIAILVASFLGISTKLSFAAALPLIAALVLWEYFRARRIPWKLMLCSFVSVGIFLGISYWRSGDWLYPYNYINSTSSLDWKSYGFGSYWKDLFGFIPGIALVPYKFGHLNDGTASIAILLGTLGAIELFAKGRHRKEILLCFAVLVLALLPTRYIRYSMFIWGVIPLFIFPWIQGLQGKKIFAGHALAIFILVLQMALIPCVGWWVKMPGEVFTGHYSETKAFEQIRGKDWTDLQEAAANLQGSKGLFISSIWAKRYYWTHMISPFSLISLSWQSGFLLGVPQSSEELKSTLNTLKLDRFIYPIDEIDKLPKGNFEELFRNSSYVVYALKPNQP